MHKHAIQSPTAAKQCRCVQILSLGISNATEEQLVNSAIRDMPKLKTMMQTSKRTAAAARKPGKGSEK